MKTRKVLFWGLFGVLASMMLVGVLFILKDNGHITNKNDLIPQHEHIVVVDYAVEATCTSEGLTEGSHCSVCNTILTTQIVIPIKAHTEVIDSAKAATCTAAGLTEGKHCSVCGVIIIAQNEIAALGHNEVTDEAETPTCTSQGATQGTHCSACGEIFVAQTVIPALTHNEVIDAYKAPSCSVTGLTEGKHCSVCGVVTVAQIVIPATGHTEIIDERINPSCLENGLTEGKHCAECGVVIIAQNEIAALGHNEVIDEAEAPTCTSQGATQGTHCSACGEIFVAQTVLPALAHNEVIDAYKAPSCSVTGLTEGKHCSVCGTVTVTQTVIPTTKHTEVVDARVEPSCIATGLTAGKHCSVCGTITVIQTVIPMTGHAEVVDARVEPSCTATGLTAGKHCSVCGKITVAQTIISAKGHVVVEKPYVAPTCSSDGFTEGKYCLVCNKILVAQKIIEKTNAHNYSLWRLTTAPTATKDGKETRACIWCKEMQSRSVTWDTVDWSFLDVYNSRYGYEYLGTLDNGAALQALYDEIDGYVRRFHFDTSINAGSDCVIATINFKDSGLHSYHVNIVFKIYRYDNPLYYWLSDTEGGVGYDRTLLVNEEYRSGAVRERYNTLIFDAIDKYTSLVSGKTSAYEIALTYRNAIVEATEYADDANKDEVWAHNILGVFEKGSGVCESYTKAFQLLLNVSGVENIYVVGSSGYVGHTWNLVKMDDGKWYWCDVTWDDGSNSYNFFCVGDSTSFLSNHKIGSTSFHAQHYLYELPSRPTTNYKHQ